MQMATRSIYAVSARGQEVTALSKAVRNVCGLEASMKTLLCLAKVQEVLTGKPPDGRLFPEHLE